MTQLDAKRSHRRQDYDIPSNQIANQTLLSYSGHTYPTNHIARNPLYQSSAQLINQSYWRKSLPSHSWNISITEVHLCDLGDSAMANFHIQPAPIYRTLTDIHIIANMVAPLFRYMIIIGCPQKTDCCLLLSKDELTTKFQIYFNQFQNWPKQKSYNAKSIPFYIANINLKRMMPMSSGNVTWSGIEPLLNINEVTFWNVFIADRYSCSLQQPKVKQGHSLAHEQVGQI